MVFLYLPCSRWVYNDDMRYLTHYSQICFGRRTTLHGAIRGEKPRYDMQQSTMGTMIEWYHIFGLDWPYRDCMDTILIEDKMHTWYAQDVLLHHPTIQMMWKWLEEYYWGTRRREVELLSNTVGIGLQMLVWFIHNNICIENAWNHHTTHPKLVHIAIN